MEINKKKQYIIGYDENRGMYLGNKKLFKPKKTYIKDKFLKFIDNCKDKEYYLAFSPEKNRIYLQGNDFSVEVCVDEINNFYKVYNSRKELRYVDKKSLEMAKAIDSAFKDFNGYNIDEKENSNIARKVKRSNEYVGKKVVIVSATVLALTTAFMTLLAKANKKDDNIDYNNIKDNKLISENMFEEDIPLEEKYIFDTSEDTKKIVINDINEITDLQNELSIEQLNDNDNVENSYEESNEVDFALENSEKQSFKCDIENIFYTPDVQEKYNEYYPLISSIASKFGLDGDLMFALAMQESSCDHEKHINDQEPAAGMFQLEKSVWKGESISAYVYNEKTGAYEYKVYDNILANPYDLVHYIEEACAIFQNYLVNYAKYNVARNLVCWNMGPGALKDIMERAAKANGTTVEEIESDPYNDCWLPYRAGVTGTFDHLERVVSNMKPGKVIRCVNVKTGEIVEYSFECTRGMYEEKTNSR